MEDKNKQQKSQQLSFLIKEVKGSKEFCAKFRDKFLCWQRPIDEGQIFVERIEGFVNFLINLALILFGLAGLVCLVNQYVDFYYLDLAASYIVKNESRQMLFFWWSVIFVAYFIYRQQREVEKREAGKISKLIENKKSGEVIEISKQFDDQAEKMIFETWHLAGKMGHQEMINAHLFVALLDVAEIKVILGRLGIGRDLLRKKITGALSRLPKSKGRPRFSLELKKTLIQSFVYAYEKKESQVSPREIMLALVTQEGVVKDLFYDMEVELDELRNVITWLDINHKIRQRIIDFNRKASYKPSSTMNKAWTAVATPFLDQFGQDMTALARAGYLQLCVGRDNEIDQIMRLIESGKKGIVLSGYPDVGKTSIIEGIAQMMVTEDVPEDLQDKRLVSLSISNLVAGGSEIGEIEGRLRKIISEINRAGNVVLFIGDIHNMTGIATSNGQLDLSEMMAEALGQSMFVTFATTDPINYRRYIRTGSLFSALSKVDINEPDKNQTIQILESKVGNIEYKQQVFFSYDSLNEAVELSQRYIQDRYLPKKAIDLLEEAAVYVENTKGKNAVVQGEDIAEVISKKIGVAATKINRDEAEVLLNLEDKIHERLIDQVPAVEAVSNALRRARTELRDLNRPITNLLFLGPTGVGKTELAKAVTQLYFGDEKKMIRVDMSEYQEKGSIDRLIGVPGETGGGILTETVKKNPYSLLLLDEIEKAHPDILNIFLQVLDDGRLTDNEGRTIDFTNLIIIATSNAGSQFIQDAIRKGKTVAELKEALVRDKLKQYFRPEFLNRFDDIVAFKTLSPEEIEQIAELFLNKLKKQMLDKGVTLKVTPAAVSELAQAGFDPEFGARPLKRVIQEKVNNALAQYLISGKIGRRDVAVYDKGGVIRIEKAHQI